MFCIARNAGSGSGAAAPGDDAKPTEKSPLHNDSKNGYATG